MRRKGRAKLCIFLTMGNYKCLMKNIHPHITPISLLIYLLHKRYIERYKRKYLGWLQGETRKLHKISEDKNLMESDRNISYTMRNLAWCVKSFGCLKWFRMVCEISHSHAKMLVVEFLPLDFFLASLIGLAKGYEVLQSLDSSCIWALTCIAMDFTKFSLILGLFQWSNSYQKHQNLPKID